MNAVILAGGLGTRLKPLTEVIPKPLLPIGEKAVLEIQIELLKRHGFDSITLATNYKADYIENFFGDGSRYGVSLTVSREDVPLGTAGPLSLLKARLTEPFLVMNGDILTSMDLSKFYHFGFSQPSLLTISVKQIIMPYAFGNIHSEGDRVTKIEEKPNFVTYALAGIYFMRPEILSLIPEKTYYGIDMLMRHMLAQGQPIMKYDMEEYWLDIGRVDDYERAQHEFKPFLTTKGEES